MSLSRLLILLGALLPLTCAQTSNSTSSGSSELAALAAVLPACGVSFSPDYRNFRVRLHS